MENDFIDKIISQWRHVRPELNPQCMRTSGRLLRVAKQVQRRTEAVLKKFRLSLWQFDVLATLRRTDQSLTCGQLMAETMLSSGAMTNRIDRLEDAGLVARRSNPSDRRGVLVELTDSGRQLIDKAIEARFAEAAAIESVLDHGEAEALARLLGKIEKGLDDLGDV
jgi:DNA-binding MarR family transcriptional regulator